MKITESMSLLTSATPRRLLSLAVLSVAALGAGAALAMNGADGGPGRGMGPGMMGPGHAPGGPMAMPGGLPGRLLDQIGATAEQKARIAAIHRAAQDDLRKLHDGSREQHEQMLAALSAATIDTAKIEALRQQALARHDQASKRRMQAMIEAANVLTPEQRAKAAEQMRKRGELAERQRKEREALDPPPAR